MNKNNLAIAFVTLSAIIIVIITAKNIDLGKVNAEFDPALTYSFDISAKNINEVEQYAALTSNGVVNSCPAPTLTKTDKGVFTFRGQGSTFVHTNFFIPVKYLVDDDSDNMTTVSSNFDEIVKDTALETAPLTTEGEIMLDFVKIEDGEVFEIIAPFNFSFNNINTSNDDSIVIYSIDNTIRVTFKNYVNWFCAGNKFSDELWTSHGRSNENPHYTIIGNSNNAKVSSGNAADVIGYGNKETSVIMEIMYEGQWTPLSIHDWIMK